MKTASFVAVTLVCAAFSAVPAAAQAVSGTGPVPSDTRGLGIGVQFNGTGVESGNASRTVAGAGLGLTLSYGMTDNLSAFARVNTGYRASQLDLGARYRLAAPSAALRPYLEAGVTRLAATRATREGGSQHVLGMGVAVGAGVEYHFDPRFALDLGVTHTRGRYNEAVLRDGGAGFSQKLTSNRVQMGFTWRP